MNIFEHANKENADEHALELSIVGYEVVQVGFLVMWSWN